MKRKFDEEHEICGDLKLLAKFYGFEYERDENCDTFRAKGRNCEDSFNREHEIFICNIPTTFTEEKLLLLLLKTRNLSTLKILKIQKKIYAFAKFSTEHKATYVCDLLNNYQEELSKIEARKCRLINAIYVANIRIRKINFYTLQFNILHILLGIRQITFYPVDKYRRYSLIIEFFKHCDTELGLELLLNDDNLFLNYPEVIVDVKCEITSRNRNEPVVIYQWKNEEDSRKIKPKITILNVVEARNLQLF